jgi:hypothetical protein
MSLRSVTNHVRALKEHDDHVSLVGDGYASFTQRLVEADTVTMQAQSLDTSGVPGRDLATSAPGSPGRA